MANDHNHSWVDNPWPPVRNILVAGFVATTWKGNPWQPWTQNLYAYVGNNPVNLIDPTGHVAECDANQNLSILCPNGVPEERPDRKPRFPDTRLSKPQTRFPSELYGRKGTALGLQADASGTIFTLSSQIQGALVLYDSGPWYDSMGLLVSASGGVAAGGNKWWDNLLSTDMIKGKLGGMAFGTGVGGIAYTNLGSLYSLAGPGMAYGGSAYVVGGAFDYLEPAPGTPDPYKGFDLSVGLGFGAEVHAQRAYTWVFTPGTVLRAGERAWKRIVGGDSR